MAAHSSMLPCSLAPPVTTQCQLLGSERALEPRGHRGRGRSGRGERERGRWYEGVGGREEEKVSRKYCHLVDDKTGFEYDCGIRATSHTSLNHPCL